MNMTRLGHSLPLGLIIGLFLVNIGLLLNYFTLLQQHETLLNLVSKGEHPGSRLLYSSSDKMPWGTSLYTLPPANCSITDSAANSAIERMKTEQCRQKAHQFVCAQQWRQWPAIKNTCPAYFNESRQHMSKGCFRDSAADRILKGKLYSMPFTNSIEHCVQKCLNAGFTHAGVEFRTECFCGFLKGGEHEERRLLDQQCDQMPCPANPGQFCGGFATVAIYTTGMQGGDHSSRWPILVPLPADDDKHYLHRKKPLIRILFLLQLNGRNVRQVKRMLRMLYAPGHLYYVNVDPTQHYMHKGKRSSKLLLGPNSESSNDLGYLEMMLGAINWTLSGVKSNFSNWDYLINLSETDMPLLPLEELEYNLFLKNGVSYMSSTGSKADEFIEKQGLNYYFMECEGRMWKILRRESFPENLRLDGGLDWMALHRDFAEYALLPDSDQTPAILRDFFSSVLLPMEAFWQTLAFNSPFCERMLYKNMRSVNWPSTQQKISYCRCNVWRKYVDWCGCWPLIFRGNDRRLSEDQFRRDFAFFGRKFDSLVDGSAIVKIERIVDAEKTKLISASSPVYDATWINLYDHEVDNNRTVSHKIDLLTRFVKAMFDSTQFKRGKCTFGHLLENNLYKANSAAGIYANFAIELNCPGQNGHEEVELLVGLKEDSAILFPPDSSPISVQNGDHQFVLVDEPQFGLGMDQKYELFREFPPLLDLNHRSNDPKPTILWRWRKDQIGQMIPAAGGGDEDKSSSPHLVATFQNESGHVVHRREVPAYDSVAGTQFMQFELSDLLIGDDDDLHNLANRTDASPAGTYTANLFTGDEQRLLFSVHFPVFPTEDDSLFQTLALRHFELQGICRRAKPTKLEDDDQWPKCEETEWSGTFPDEKAQFY